VAIALSPSPAPADVPAVLAVAIEVAASQVEERARSLSHAGDLDWTSVTALSVDLSSRVDRLADVCAPVVEIATMMPDVREAISAMQEGVYMGSSLDVESAADSIVLQMQTLRTTLRKLPLY
jgi:hypothetical protein